MKRIFRCFDLAALCASGRHHSVLWSEYRGRDSLHEHEHEHKCVIVQHSYGQAAPRLQAH